MSCAKVPSVYILCYLCGKKFEINPKKPIENEAKKHGLYRVNIENLKDGSEHWFYACEECINKLINKKL